MSFEVLDPDDALRGVRLGQEVARPRLGPEFVRFPRSQLWKLLFPKPEADRMEYQLEFTYEDGSSELVCDPFNSLRADGPFGEKSVVEFPEYRRPAWVDADGHPPGETTVHELSSRSLRSKLRLMVWAPYGTAADQALPLLVVHDGFDFSAYALLLRFLAVMTDDQRLPPMRAALLAPVDRDENYSASAAYARALTHEVLPRLSSISPTPYGRNMRVGMGASLGAVAMLHVHRQNAASFGALYLQSGSFFRHKLDKQEASLPRFRRIARFVGHVLAREEWSHPIPVSMTCGSAEENLANNRLMHQALKRQGYEVSLQENRDAHNWVAWRDTFDPHLADLLGRVWS